MSGDIAVREAAPDELPAVMNVLDGAQLATDASTVGARVRRGEVLVAVADDRVLGACVLDPGRGTGSGSTSGAHVRAIAVRPRRRGQGIGGVLVDAAAARYGELAADFDGRVHDFYEALGFEIERDGDRYRGTFEA